MFEDYTNFAKVDKVLVGNYKDSLVVKNNSIGYYLDALFTDDPDWYIEQPRRQLKYGPMSKEVYTLLFNFLERVIKMDCSDEDFSINDFIKNNYEYSIWKYALAYLYDYNSGIKLDIDKLKSDNVPDEAISMYNDPDILRQISELYFTWMFDVDDDIIEPLYLFMINGYCFDENGFHHIEKIAE